MSKNDDIYAQLGVSSKKEEVHEAVKNLDKGLFPGAFCKIVEDIHDRKNFCSIFHSDGAGTKSSLAYMYFRETNDISIFRNVVKDAMVMNIDDMLCVGAIGPFFLSNNIGRNSKFISGEIIETIIYEYASYCDFLTKNGIKVTMGGGETADVGDIVKTILIDASVFTSMRRNEVINASDIKVGDVIIGMASYGKATYEEEYNSGIGSNGLTLARHGVLSHSYYEKYPECYDRNLDEELIFFGKYFLTDKIKGMELNIGKALLSPTRTYGPVLIEILKNYKQDIDGIIHNTGGGQTKVLNFGKGINYIKNNLFHLPKIFEVIQNSSETQWKEMYKVFNMGNRMEIYCEEEVAKEIINIARKYNIDTKIIGLCEKSSQGNKNTLDINSEFGSFTFE